jgi:hypothetical protein
MAPRKKNTPAEQAAADLITVHRNALVDKEEILDAIDTRMSKLGNDHDLLIHICDLVETNDKKVTNLGIILVGEHGDDGLVESSKATSHQVKYMWIAGAFVGSSLITAVTYLVILHIHI